MIPYGRQDITEADIEAVIEVLRSDFITQGPVVSRFEEALAARCNVAHAVAVNSATSALHIACLALGWVKAIGSGPPRTPSWHRLTAAYTAAQRSISSISTL